jgi:hypothetical protein
VSRIWPTINQCGISGPKAQIILQKSEAGGRRAEIRPEAKGADAVFEFHIIPSCFLMQPEKLL